MGIIHECGGKMHMAERQWAEAATDFFEAFKNYDEAGNQRRIQCLKCVYGIFLIIDSENIFFNEKIIMHDNILDYTFMQRMYASSMVECMCF